MHHPPATPEERFATLVEALRGHTGVTMPGEGAHATKGFGSSELKVHNKIFAMLVRGRLVVKLPRQRVETLVAAGGGERFDPRRDGRLMKEWLVVDPALEEQWLPLAREALEHVAAA
jgi:hypothetical protein